MNDIHDPLSPNPPLMLDAFALTVSSTGARTRNNVSRNKDTNEEKIKWTSWLEWSNC
jgi:hypothetical protein